MPGSYVFLDQRVFKRLHLLSVFLTVCFLLSVGVNSQRLFLCPFPSLFPLFYKCDGCLRCPAVHDKDK